MQPDSSSRTRIALVALLGLTLSACESASAPLAPEQALFSKGIDQQGTAALNQQLAALRRATASFHNFGKAEEAGYGTPITPCWYHRDLGGQGYHYGKPALIDGTVSLLQPEILMYEPQKGGGLRLVGVEYIIPIDMWKDKSPPTLFGQEFHRHPVLPIYALHVWLWRHNPDGMFADWNPMVSCEHAAEAEDRAP